MLDFGGCFNLTILEGGTVLISSSLTFLVMFQCLGSIAAKEINYGPRDSHAEIQCSDKTDAG